MCVAQTWMGGTLRPALAISLAFVVRISVMEDVRTFCLQFNGEFESSNRGMQRLHLGQLVDLADGCIQNLGLGN